MNTSSLPPAVRALASRMKTRASLHVDREGHDLKSLATRVMLSRGEILAKVAAGELLALNGPVNGKYMFSASALDTMRNGVVSFIAREIVKQLSARGADEQTMTMACQRAFTRQYDLSRQEQVIEFADPNDDTFTGGAKRGAGMVAGAAAAGAAGYLGYRYLRNRRKNGLPQLPGSGDDGMADTIDIGPGRGPSGSGSSGANEPRHPDPTAPRLATSSPTPDLLADAVRKGRMSIAARGSSILRALRGAV